MLKFGSPLTLSPLSNIFPSHARVNGRLSRRRLVRLIRVRSPSFGGGYMRRAVITTLLLIPVGAAIGFLSSAVIAAGYDVISTTFREVIYSDSERANNAIGITLVA